MCVFQIVDIAVDSKDQHDLEQSEHEWTVCSACILNKRQPEPQERPKPLLDRLLSPCVHLLETWARSRREDQPPTIPRSLRRRIEHNCR